MTDADKIQVMHPQHFGTDPGSLTFQILASAEVCTL